MATFEIDIPISDGSDFEFYTNLDGVKFWFLFKSNVRMAGGSVGCWTMDILDASKEPILQGIRCVVKYPLLVRGSDARLPVGQLYLIDMTDKDLDPGLYDLGDRVKLVYRQEG